MPKAPPISSTQRRLNLASYIDIYGDVMPVSCHNCRRQNLVCRVHVRSGRCNECNRSNAKDCNIRISENEWSVIKEEKDRLQARLEALEREAAEVRRALRENADRAAEAISVEESEIQRLEQQEASLSIGPDLAMSPFTWSAMDGLGDEVWDATVPSYLGDSLVGNEGTAPSVGGS
jgi:hypothetical protein